MTFAQRCVKVASAGRDAIDKQLESIKNYLEATGVGYKGSLIDKEGFPLPNVDHYEVRRQRARAARLLNDRKRIEHVLEELVQTVPENGKQTLLMELENQKPFAIISEVRQGSPAEEAGLLDGDFLIRFGTATTLLDVTKNIAEGKAIELLIYRVNEYDRGLSSLSITPKHYEGEGLIGCHLIPI